MENIEKVERIVDEIVVTSILSIYDERLNKLVLSHLQCTKMEWVQWLTDNLKLKNFLSIWGVRSLENKNQLKHYAVVINAVNPPISRSCYILYQNFYTSKLREEAFEKIKEWARTLGAKSLCATTNHLRIAKTFGFKKDGYSIYIDL